MKCPRDGTVLASVQLLGLQLDKCHQCDGIWFDRGELERLRDAKVDEAEHALERKYGNPRVQTGAVGEYMRCPRCGDARLLQSIYTYVSQVSIDRCERCHGIWLDDGELDAIIGEKKKLDQADHSNSVRAFFRVVDRLVHQKK